jgi:hypothetical protein
MHPQQASRAERRALEIENGKFPVVLQRQSFPASLAPPKCIEVWRSRWFLVQVYAEQPGLLRASVCRTRIDSDTGRWRDGIAWEDLQLIKREIGRGHLDAVEIFPADSNVVNVANMRHLWITEEPIPFAWRKR